MNNKSKLDKAALDEALAAHRKLIEKALDSEDRHRFSTVQKIAKISELLLSFDNPRVGDFDAMDDNIIMGGRIPMMRHMGEDSNEVMRTIVDTVSPLLEQQKAKGRSELLSKYAEEYKSMVELRATLQEQDESTEDIDARIDFLKKELAKKENENALVPTELLRGHSLGENQEGMLGEVGAPDGD